MIIALMIIVNSKNWTISIIVEENITVNKQNWLIFPSLPWGLGSVQAKFGQHSPGPLGHKFSTLCLEVKLLYTQ